jgi:hypothetical protein
MTMTVFFTSPRVSHPIVYECVSDIYGTSSPDPLPSASAAPSVKTRTVTHISLCDSLPAYGPISDLTFALAKNGVSPVQSRFCATTLMNAPCNPHRRTALCRSSSPPQGPTP